MTCLEFTVTKLTSVDCDMNIILGMCEIVEMELKNLIDRPHGEGGDVRDLAFM